MVGQVVVLQLEGVDLLHGVPVAVLVGAREGGALAPDRETFRVIRAEQERGGVLDVEIRPCIKPSFDLPVLVRNAYLQ